VLGVPVSPALVRGRGGGVGGGGGHLPGPLFKPAPPRSARVGPGQARCSTNQGQLRGWPPARRFEDAASDSKAAQI
jgi:hypothetical protein